MFCVCYFLGIEFLVFVEIIILFDLVEIYVDLNCRMVKYFDVLVGMM